MNELAEGKAQGSVTQHIFPLVFLAVASEKGTHLIFVLSSLTYSMIMSVTADSSDSPLKDSPTRFQVPSITVGYLGQPSSKLHLGITLVPLLKQIPVVWSSGTNSCSSVALKFRETSSLQPTPGNALLEPQAGC